VQPKLAEDGKHASNTVALPPFGPPRSRGTDALCPDFTTTREAPGDKVKSVKVTVKGTGELVEGAKPTTPELNPTIPRYTAVTCSAPEGSVVAGSVVVPVETVGFIPIEGVSPTPPKTVPLADRSTIPWGAPICDWLAVTVTVNVTEPELSTLEGLSDKVVVVAEAVALTNVYGAGDV